MCGAIFFTQLDLSKSFWQFLLAKECRELTAFTVPGMGKFEYNRLPFGIKNSPANHNRLIASILDHLPFVKIYFDDITIFSKEFEEHIDHIRQELTIMREVNLKLNSEKCAWAVKKIKILGYILKDNNVLIDPSKIQCIINRLPPTNIKELQIFLGCTNYYRRFINKFAEMAKPLFNLLKTGQKYDWSIECKEAFEALKEALVNKPVLRTFDPTLPILLVCDASGYAASCILSKTDQDGHEFVISYADYLFNKHEINYTISEKECLAVIFGIKHFRHYVHGTFFTIITDHSALLWLNSISDPIGRLARWAILLQEYRFKVVHRKGSSNCAADARFSAIMPDEESDDSNKSVDPWEDEYLLYYLQFGRHRDGSSKKQVKRCLSLAEVYNWSEGALYFTLADSVLPVPKPLDRKNIILKAHALGHFCAEATSNALRNKYY
jgi:hypothetical protein